MIFLKLYFVAWRWKLGVITCSSSLLQTLATDDTMSLVPGHRVKRSFWSFHWGASLFWLLINDHVAVRCYVYWPVALVAHFGDSPGFRGIGQDQHQASGRRRSLSPRSTCDTFQKVLPISLKGTCNTWKGTDLHYFCAGLSNELTLNSLSVLSSRQAALERGIKCQIVRRVRWCRCCICFMCFRCCWCCRWCSCCICFICFMCYWCYLCCCFRWCSKSFRCYSLRCCWYFWCGGWLMFSGLWIRFGWFDTQSR